MFTYGGQVSLPVMQYFPTVLQTKQTKYLLYCIFLNIGKVSIFQECLDKKSGETALQKKRKISNKVNEVNVVLGKEYNQY